MLDASGTVIRWPGGSVLIRPPSQHQTKSATNPPDAREPSLLRIETSVMMPGTYVQLCQTPIAIGQRTISPSQTSVHICVNHHAAGLHGSAAR